MDMPSNPPVGAVKMLQAALGAESGPSDGHLLESFVAARDESAFAALVRRHGPMVLGVCRRILGHHQDAEDAFQVTFLVLARRAAVVTPRELVGSWLYGVARRTALTARARIDRRHTRELQVQELPEQAVEPVPNGQELRQVLDSELSRLPSKYRVPLVLCELEARPRKEVARLLGLPVGTLSSRLAKARHLLGGRVARRGVVLPAGTLAAALAGSAAVAAAPLVESTVKAATSFAYGAARAVVSPRVAGLAEEVLGIMWVAKAKGILLVFLGVLILAGGLWSRSGALTGTAGAADQPAAVPIPPREKAPRLLADETPDLAAEAARPGVDAYGDPLPDGARARLGTARLRHGAAIYAGAFSPDGTLFASLDAYHDHRLCLWDVRTGKELHRIFTGHHAQGVVAFAADGKTVLTAGGGDRFLRRWDVQTGKEVGATELAGGLTAAIFSADSKTLVLSGPKHFLQLRDTASGKIVRELVGLKKPADRLALTPDGTTLAVVLTDNRVWSVEIWDVSAGRRRHELRRSQYARVMTSGNPTALAFAPDNRTLAVGYQDGRIDLWDVRSGLAIKEHWEAHKGFVETLRFAPDGKYFTSACADHQDHTVRLWDAATGKQRRCLEGKAYRDLAFAKDGKMLATSGEDNAVHFWDPATGTEFLPYGKQTPAVRALACSADGKVLATVDEQSLTLWDVGTGRELRRIPTGPVYVLHSLAFSPDGKSVAVGMNDQSVGVWDTATGKPLARLKGQSSYVRGIAFSADGKTLIAGGEDSIIRFWDIASGAERRKLVIPRELTTGFLGLALAADGKTLVTITGRPTAGCLVVLWDAVTGEKLRHFAIEDAMTFALSPDGKTLATGEWTWTIRLWDLATGRQRHRLRGHREHVRAVAFAPDSKTLVSASGDRTMRLWDVASGTPRRHWPAEPGLGLAAAFTADGRTLVSAGAEGSALLWDFARLGRTAAKKIEPAPVSREEAEQNQAIGRARTVELPGLEEADLVVIDEVGRPTRVTLERAEAVKEIRQALKVRKISPAADKTVATLSFFRDNRLLQKVWVYPSGEWGFERADGPNVTLGCDAELFQLIERHLQRCRPLAGAWKQAGTPRTNLLRFEAERLAHYLDGQQTFERVAYVPGPGQNEVKVLRKVQLKREPFLTLRVNGDVLTVATPGGPKTFKRLAGILAELDIKRLPVGRDRYPARQKVEAIRKELARREALSIGFRLELRKLVKPEEREPKIKELLKIDEGDSNYLIDVIKEVGWIDERRFGEQALHSAYLIVMHTHNKSLMWTGTQELRKEVKAGHFDAESWAGLHDRFRLITGQRERFGFHVYTNPQGSLVLGPLEDRRRVDQLRQEVGLPPLAAYLARYKESNKGREVRVVDED
jgi:RNA polymerase sigma factor (sigma-70 family)